MCLIFISLHHHPNYKLIVAANRDEFYARQTAQADSCPDACGGAAAQARAAKLGRPRGPPPPHGAIAQLGERLDRTQEVGGSSPPSSIFTKFLQGRGFSRLRAGDVLDWSGR